MKVKVDENLPDEFGEILRAAGFRAHSVREERLSGGPDAVVLNRIRAEGRVLITLDLDFANILAYPPAGLPGIVVIRSKTQDNAAAAWKGGLQA